jgi:hypothetical protein
MLEGFSASSKREGFRFIHSLRLYPSLINGLNSQFTRIAARFEFLTVR